jgi:hypothetical protein
MGEVGVVCLGSKKLGGCIVEYERRSNAASLDEKASEMGPKASVRWQITAFGQTLLAQSIASGSRIDRAY